MNNTLKLAAGLALSGLFFSAHAQTTPAPAAQTAPAADSKMADTKMHGKMKEGKMHGKMQKTKMTDEKTKTKM
ncbi:hypothetical protein [Hymenobacter baengnokdamensis]|uniref:hypothetical protein n=1 Tax=Hymenobacter baengnokdamensis TaxID=2615203 RepID=UPI0012484E64|nr:hypothetical protein [Hymenobacter baengnokdamensis]